MKEYLQILGPSKAPHAPCICFDKFDGSNIRMEWDRKNGWHKFGTRTQLFDKTSEQWGHAIDVFNQTYADDLIKVFSDKYFRSVSKVTVFCEYFGPSSFAGWHDYEELKTKGELVLFDVEIYKKGFMVPRDFINYFGHLKIPAVIYVGNFNNQLIEDVKAGKYPVYEGVVAKGVIGKKGGKLWMAKIKTRKWLDDLKNKAKLDESFKKSLVDNEREQQ